MMIYGDSDYIDDDVVDGCGKVDSDTNQLDDDGGDDK